VFTEELVGKNDFAKVLVLSMSNEKASILRSHRLGLEHVVFKHTQHLTLTIHLGYVQIMLGDIIQK
jgi:hypothetical protein